MDPSFDPVQQFFSMWAQANSAVWPMELLWYVAAIAAVALAMNPNRYSSRIIAGFLAAYYAWLGIVFFVIYYSPISDHAIANGAMFVIGGLLFLLAGVFRRDLQFEARWNVLGVTGGLIMLYALAIYPVIGMVTGRFFPAAPLFGLAPCPSTIFTAGLLLWSRPRMPMYVLTVPLVWLLAMTPSDAIAMDVYADVARPFVGVVATTLLIWRDYRATRERLIGGAVLLIGVLCLGHDDLLWILAGLFLLATFVRWLVRRPRAGHTPRSVAAPAPMQ